MLTYRVRPRRFKIDVSALPPLPVEAHVSFHLTPDQPFGAAAGGGRTAIRAVPATVCFNADTGQHSIESKEPLAPLKVEIHVPDQTVTLSGTHLEVVQMIGALEELRSLVEAVYYVFPLLLTPHFADPPLVAMVDGSLGGVPFRWELSAWQGTYHTTTQQQQDEHVRRAWARLALVASPEARRLLAALHYFHVACRLERLGACPGEFLSESLLNLAKVLEVLFQDSRDVARQELLSLGFSGEEVERDFIPAMLLRSKIDVAHVSLALFTPDQLQTLHRYADRAEAAFRRLLQRLLDRLDSGTLQLPQYELHGADGEIAITIQTLAERLAALGDRP